MTYFLSKPQHPPARPPRRAGLSLPMLPASSAAVCHRNAPPHSVSQIVPAVLSRDKMLLMISFNMKIKVNIERLRSSHESFAAVDCNCCLALHHNSDEIILPHCCAFVLSWCTFQFPLGPLLGMCTISTTQRSQCVSAWHLQTSSCCHKTVHEQDEQQLQLAVTVGHCTFISIFKFHFIDFF